MFPGDSPEQISRWRTFVSELLLVVTACTTAILLAMLVGWPLIGRLLWTSEAKAIAEASHEPILTRIETVERQIQKIQEVENAVKLLTSAVNEGLADRAAAQIRILTLRRCRAPSSEEREMITRQIEEQQREYIKYAGHSYFAPRCSEL